MLLSIYKYIVCWKSVAPDFTFSTVSYRRNIRLQYNQTYQKPSAHCIEIFGPQKTFHTREKKRNRTALVCADLSRSSFGMVASDPLTRSSTRHTKALRLRFYWFCIRLCMVAITAIDAHPSQAMVACTYALLVKHRALRDCVRCVRIRNPQLCPSSSSGAIVGLNGDVVCKWCVKKVKLFTLLFAGRTTTPASQWTHHRNWPSFVMASTRHTCDRLMACNLLWVAWCCICKVNAHCCTHGIMGSVSSNFANCMWIAFAAEIQSHSARSVHMKTRISCAHTKYRT